MKLLFYILSIIIFLCNDICAQVVDTSPIEDLFIEQISNFPQEKAYVQTDRNVYMSGETIWLRVHLVDALFLKQANASRYVYLELINPVNDITQRIKLRPDSTGCFYGNIQLDEDLIEGNYSLRAYTRFMQNQGEDYFFHKSIYIADPVSEKLSPEVIFSEDGDKIKAEITIVNKQENIKITPEQCLIFPDANMDVDGKSLVFEENIGHYTFKTKRDKLQKPFILQVVFEGKIYNRYFNIPALDKTFDVSFFPEGGHAPFSTDVKVAFKAINANGLSEDIKGEIFDDLGQSYATFESTHLGMGNFRMYYSPGRKYHAICTSKDNISKRFDLPEASDNAVSLKLIWGNNKLRVTLAKSPNYELPPQTQLIAHIRGAVIYAQPWDDTSGYLSFEQDFFPAGIVHFLLIDNERNILSERLMFSSQESTFAKSYIKLDKEAYKARDKINMSIQITDEHQAPLAGNFSLAIVDTKDVTIDTTSNIISTLLLSSELKGYIESPMSYLQKDNKQSAQALDILMMTQGWRRYNIPDILKGEIKRTLQYPVELGDEISGKAEGVFSALKEGGISLLAVKDSVIGTSLVEPDKKGRFVFKNLEYPDGTKYIIQALTKKGSKRVFLELDTLKSFPPLTLPIRNIWKEPYIKDTYISKMNQKYTTENGMRIYNLAEVVVTAKRKQALETESPYYSVNSSKVLTEKDVEKWNILSVFDLLRRIPGVNIVGEEVRYRNATPMVVLDNVPEDAFDYSRLNVSDIKDVFLLPSISAMPFFGGRAAGGAVVISTKKGFVERNTLNSNIQIVKSIGYRQTVEFYSPVYTTDEEKNNVNPDLRTTIYWNPNVQADSSGIAKISFYAADAITQYGIVIEGVSSLGHLIYSGQKEISIATGR